MRIRTTDTVEGRRGDAAGIARPLPRKSARHSDQASEACGVEETADYRYVLVKRSCRQMSRLRST
jgi:hypothetical protein